MKIQHFYSILTLGLLLFCFQASLASDKTNCPAAGTPCNDNNPKTTNDMEDGNCNCKGMLICSPEPSQSKGPNGLTRNPWGMTQQQYELYENTSVSAINALPGTDPNYGALPLPDVSYVTNQPDNGSSPTIAQFRFLAAPSHYLKDDPIVFPNQPGASHLHMFFGNTRADANSEVGTGTQNDLLIRGASTVQGGKGANPTSYWVPALVDGPLNGCATARKIILPDAITVYYKTRRPGESKLVPEGLQVIGGNLPQSPGGMVHGMTIQNSGGGSFREGARWGFYDPNQGLLVEGGPTIPQSNPSGYKWVRAAIGFPQCFAAESNGEFKLSSPDNLSHQKMLEDAQGWNRDDDPCPSSHPNRIAKVEILLDFRWPADNDVSGWRLSSDMGSNTDAQVPHPGGSLHGDIYFAWNTKVQQAWKDECLDPNDPRNCSGGQTGTQWILDRIANTSTITNMVYNGPTKYLSDPYDDCSNPCPPAGTPCDDNDPKTINDVYDNNCVCAGTCPAIGTPCDDNDPTTINDEEDGLCTCSGTPINIPTPGICQFDSPPVLDGADNEWPSDSLFYPTKVLGGTVNGQGDLSGEFKLGWDDSYLYVFGRVIDDALFNDSPNPWNDDCFELYIDGGNEKGTTYDGNDFQLMFRYNDPVAYNFPLGPTNPAGLDFVMQPTNLGYNVEIRVSWAFIGIPPVADGSKIGFDVHINDDDDGGLRDKFISWNDDQNLAWTNPSVFGEVLFEDCQSAFIIPDICLWMEGAYDFNTNQMTTLLAQRNLIPIAQPYNTPPWNYTGSETMTNLPAQSVDWVKVSFRTAATKSSEVLATAAILQEDGCLLFPDPDFFPESLGSSFFVVVEHRNHIGVMSPTAINVNQGTFVYDFRGGDSYAPGGQGQEEIAPGVWAMFAGDGDQLQDLNGYDINGIDNVSWAPENGKFNVYGFADYNLDGDVSGMDKILWSANNGVYSTLAR